MPPCLECYRSGNQCILGASRRGGNLRLLQSAKTPGSSNSVARAEAASPPKGETSRHRCRNISANSEQEHAAAGDDDHADNDNNNEENASYEELGTELRNPSDALHILAQSDDTPYKKDDMAARPPTSNSGDTAEAGEASTSQFGERPAVVLDKFELITRGLLPRWMLPELLHM